MVILINHKYYDLYRAHDDATRAVRFGFIYLYEDYFVS